MRLKILLGVLLLGLFIGANAYYSTPGDILIDNQVVMRVRSAAGGMFIEERVGTIYGRIVEALRQEKPEIKIVQINKMPTIWMGGIMLVTVDEETAKANAGASVTELAKVWVKNIENALKDP